MSERLQHLHRQRALLQEHLAWIESEIRAESAAVTPPASIPSTPPADLPEPPPLPPAATIGPAPSRTLPAPDADRLLDSYRNQEALDPRAARRGCLLVFTTTLLILAAIVLSIYFFRYRH